VLFAHDTEVALQVCVALVNDEPHRAGPLASPEALVAHLTEAEDTGAMEGTRAELEAVLARLPRLRELLLAERDEAADLVNAILAEAGALPQLRRHGGWDWHLHAIEETRPLADRIAVETAMAMVDLIRADETHRIATCAASGCDDVLVDLSRNRSRRFCSATCGNREAVAAYRARQRG
jgi:predicted RNA-binding Zn ribbon-like protein